jgi:hypothetical protein
VPLGTKELVSDDLEIRASQAPHHTKAYYVCPALKHYQCLGFYMHGTRQYRVANTWQLFPMHCTTPTMSPAECTMLQTTDPLSALGGTVPTSTSVSIACTQAIQKLCEILLPMLCPGARNPLATNTPSPRVLRSRLPTTQEPRVPTPGPSPRVIRASACKIATPPTRYQNQMPTTSHDPNAPSNICLLQAIRQQHTQATTHLPSWRTMPWTRTPRALLTTSQYKPTTE